MKRIIQGKPVFDPLDDMDPHQRTQLSQSPQTPSLPVRPAGPESTIVKGNDRTFPVVQVKSVKSRANGSNMQVYCRIRNSWQGDIEVDKIRLLNATQDLNFSLRPNEEREVLCYSGPRMPREQYRDAELEYKTKDGGDYFKAIHTVGFHPQSDGTYMVDEVRLRPPIRDIYG